MKGILFGALHAMSDQHGLWTRNQMAQGNHILSFEGRCRDVGSPNIVWKNNSVVTCAVGLLTQPLRAACHLYRVRYADRLLSVSMLFAARAWPPSGVRTGGRDLPSAAFSSRAAEQQYRRKARTRMLRYVHQEHFQKLHFGSREQICHTLYCMTGWATLLKLCYKTITCTNCMCC